MTIGLYTYATPNGHKASIMLEETGLRYAVHVVDIERYEREAARLFGVLNERLCDRDYLLGDYGIADIANWPWIDAFPQLGLTLNEHPNLKRWHQEIAKRPAVIRGLAVPNLIELKTT